MKGHYVFLSVVIVCLLSGCTSQPPGWFIHPASDSTTLYGAGLAEIGESSSITNDNQALQTATTRARQDLLLQLESSLSAMRIDYSQGDSNFYESVTRELNADILQNSRVENRALKGRKYYVQVSYKIANVTGVVENAARKARLDAQDALRTMDDALNKSRSR
ncbi:MAG: hypothetical protein LBK73_05615 [Treponema sp.]|jgi:hypothetical protein|nr:hypothetical protein [Treponema sp.]